MSKIIELAITLTLPLRSKFKPALGYIFHIYTETTDSQYYERITIEICGF